MSCDKYTTCNAFTYSAMISFHCVVNNDPGVDKYTQEGLEVNSGFSQKVFLLKNILIVFSFTISLLDLSYSRKV